MKRKIIPILGLSGLALSGLAAPFQYNDGDLILDFSKTGYSDVVVNIGNIGNLYNAAFYAGGTATLSGTDFNITSQLLGTFGSVNGLTFTVFGLQNNAAGSVAAQTVYLSQAQTDPIVPNSPPHDVSSTHQIGLVGLAQSIIGVGNSTGILPWSAANPINAVNNTNTVAIIPTSGAALGNSYTSKGQGQWGSQGVPDPANSTSSTFSTDGGSVISDLFEYDYYASGGTSHNSIYQGYFALGNDGSLTFSAVPEPSTYGLMTAGGALVLLLHNQRRRKSA